MRIANLSGRLVLVTDDDTAVDVEQASGGRFGPDPQGVYERWNAFREWAGTADLPAGRPFAAADLGSPAPAPRQLLAIGLNYRAHADESGFEAPDTLPPVFTKYVSSITGPVTEVRLPKGGHTDWEVELVAVIGERADQVDAEDAWLYVAGLTVGQDISERITQLTGPAPQFGLGKSYPGFTPMGPYLVTPDALDNSDDLELGCSINGEEVQKGRTRDLIFSVPALVSRLSAVLPLLPGDVIFTGTPAGVGMGRTPQRWLTHGDVLVSRVRGIGELRQTFRD
ncbi:MULTISPECIES: fumarylacetoacetate hydrolase family protein [unclassified Streptomyces]|uniref:fumarylacetoacetate hydrolase family protein n=1 Tax=unclassified Streptomyces TaxID=2593676 RepID=UPI00168AEBB3|nr:MULTISPECIES: fumarylacetoacetate hydrolase family protein [unclassified Streptomyces]MBD3007597.1 fumarylacetoacetate hydrolase family protein [Streptomyces sp. 5-10]